MENFNHFVSSRGLLRSCDFHSSSPQSSSSRLDINFLEGLGSSDSIYLCTDALVDFAINYLPKISTPFILVSGDSDLCVDDSILKNELLAIVDSPLLIAWYAQNLCASHPKLFPIPIGNDYHTMWEKPGLWGLSKISPLAQERFLIEILKDSPDFSRRYAMAYCNWHLAMQRGDRQECFAKVDKKSCFYEPNKIPRMASWRRQSEFMFVLSPEGIGIDCHRTWEALMLGSIPIVKKKLPSSLFDGLPVIQVDDWSEINQNRLMDIAHSVMSKKFNFSPLFLNYWSKKIHGSIAEPLEEMTLDEFKKFMTFSGC